MRSFPFLLAPLALLVACADGEPGPDGADGDPVLFDATAEAAGDNCPDGGTRLDIGVDANLDGDLEADEVAETIYLCDGDAPGEFIVDTVTSTDPYQGCAYGTVMTLIGTDDGEGGGTAGDGVLQPGEVDASYVECLKMPNPPMYAISRGTSGYPSDLYYYDPDTNVSEYVGPLDHAIITIKVNPVDGELYGMTRWESSYGGCNGCLVQIDTETARSEVVKQFTYPEGSYGSGEVGAVASMAFLSDGSLYGWTENGDDFIEMDIATGVATYAGFGDSSWSHGMCATSDDMIFWYNGNGETFYIDPTDGDATYLGNGESHPTASGGSTSKVRGDCDPDTLVYIGTDGQNQSSQSSVVTMQFYTDQAPTLVETYYASDVSKFHYMAFSHL